MNNKEYVVINKLLSHILGHDQYYPDVNASNIENIYNHLVTTCPTCGANVGEEYLSRYGMCMGCYGYMVCADNCPCTKPDKENVLNGIFEVLFKGGNK